MTRNSLLHWMLIGGRGKQLRRAEAAFPLTLIRAADVRVWKVKIHWKKKVKKSNVFDARYKSFHAMSEGNRRSVRKLKRCLNSRVCRSKPPKWSNSVSNVGFFLTSYFSLNLLVKCSNSGTFSSYLAAAGRCGTHSSRSLLVCVHLQTYKITPASPDHLITDVSCSQSFKDNSLMTPRGSA